MERAAFFDIGDTLGAVRVAPGGAQLEITPFPGVVGSLTALRDGGVRLGIISNRGSVAAAVVEAALDGAGLLTFFERDLVVFGPKDSVEIFEQASSLVDTPHVLGFVGEDAVERDFARLAGYRTCPAAVLAPRVMLGVGAALRYVRIRVPQPGLDWRALLRDLRVPVLHESAGEVVPTLYAISDDATAVQLDERGLWVDRLGATGEPERGELYLLRADAVTGGAPARIDGLVEQLGDEPSARHVLASTSEGLYVALPAGESVDSLHLGSARHGHNLKLTPVDRAPRDDVSLHARAGPDRAATTLTGPEIGCIRHHVTAPRIRRDVARYSGERPISGRARVSSRHVHHADNAVAVQALLDDLTAAGLAVREHTFTHEGRTLTNVEATLPGTGLPGSVVLSAHLDSTAARAAGYRPAVDPAPGADDDASGLAAVLAAARALVALAADSGAPRRELRLVLFNAEEQGLVGSRAYVRDEAARASDVVAAFQLDMVGFDAVPGRAFELHAGFSTDPDVQAASVALAGLVAAMAAQLSPAMPAPQVYPGPDGTRDPAEQRSDHFSFQLFGYPACLASEDFFAGPGPDAPAPDANPDYHLPTDTAVATTYARDIARAVTAAAWVCSTR